MQSRSEYHVPKSEILAEREQIEAAQADPAKFGALYQKYHEPIFRFVFQRVTDEHTAADVTQQVFLKVMMNLHKYQFRGLPFSAWLFRIARNEMSSMFRKNKVRRTINIEDTHIYELIDDIDEDRLEAFRDIMIDTIDQLPELEIQLLEMRYFEKRPYAEIADIMEITENNAKVRMYRILGKLKKKITAK